MKIFTLHRKQFLPVTIEDAWGFFSVASNLEKITPQNIKFRALTSLGDQQIHSGMKISYEIRPLMNIPMKWVTEIRDVVQLQQFVDIQVRGPYALWEHRHTFVPVPGGVEMTDNVRYAMPFGLFGTIAHKLMIKKKLNQIFEFRRAAVGKIFGSN